MLRLLDLLLGLHAWRTYRRRGTAPSAGPDTADLRPTPGDNVYPLW